MESLNALLQGMGLMRGGGAIMLLVSLLLLWLAIAKKFRPLLLLPMKKLGAAVRYSGGQAGVPESCWRTTTPDSWR